MALSLQSIDPDCNKISHITYATPDFLGNIHTGQKYLIYLMSDNDL